jgi:type IV pilus assembly protein PilW
MMTPRTHRQPPSHARHQAGMSLIELMIAVAIGLALLAGLSSLYVSTSKARGEFNKTSEQVENGRFALQSIRRDIEMAGFYGRASLGGGVTYTLPDPCAIGTPAFSSTTATPAVPVGVAGLPVGAAAPTCLTNKVLNSEVLTVRYASGVPTSASSITAGEYYVQLSACTTDATKLVYDTTKAKFVLQTRTCAGTLAELRKYVVRSYYLASCDICGTDSTPTLKVAEFLNGSVQVSSLVNGIQDVHYSYGVDIDGNGSPDCYVDNPAIDNSGTCPAGYVFSPDTATNWSNVTTVRVNLLSRNLDKTASWTDSRTYDLGHATVDGPYNDRYKRHVYSTVARIWNTGGLRENP